MKPVTYVIENIHGVLGEQGMYVIDTIFNKWLDIAEPTMRFFFLPWIKVSGELKFIYFQIHVIKKLRHFFISPLTFYEVCANFSQVKYQNAKTSPANYNKIV